MTLSHLVLPLQPAEKTATDIAEIATSHLRGNDTT
jgi:hypothetical protein